MDLANNISGDAYKFYKVFSNVMILAKIVVFVVFGLIAFFRNRDNANKELKQDTQE